MAPKKKPQASSPAAATPARAAAAASTTKKDHPPPRPLTPRMRLLLLLALPLTMAGFLVGCAGMAVLVGPPDLLPFIAPDSKFARAWRDLLSKNLFFQPFLFNFGAIASVACAMRLAEDRRAALLVAAAKRR